MASKKFQKGFEEWLMFMDYWQLCQRFWEPEEQDEYWDDVAKETNLFYEKYNHVGLAEHITLALLDYLEERSRNGKK